MSYTASDQMANALRLVIGHLVRQTRHVDTLPPRFAEVLGHLDREGPLTLGGLATRQRVRQQSMSTTVAELCARGYVQRLAHPTDGRKTLISLSAEGQTRLNEDRHRRIQWLAEAISTQLTPTEQQQLNVAIPLLVHLANHPAAPDRVNEEELPAL